MNYYDEYYLCFETYPNAIQRDEINSFIDCDGLNEEVICAAFKKAAEDGAKYPYARSILNNWAKKGIKTIEDVEYEHQNFIAKKQQSRSFKRKGTIRQELLPDWFDEKPKNLDQPTLKVVGKNNQMDEYQRLMEVRRKNKLGS